MNSPKTEEIAGELRWYADFYEGSTLGLHLHRAVAHIEELEAELAALKEQQRWIPVTERLPEFAEDVHVVDAIGAVEKGMYIGDDTWLLEGGTLSTPYVRWWKAFPEPPKE